MQTRTNIPFPDPTVIAGRNFWRKGDIRRWQARLSGNTDIEPRQDDEVFLNSKQVREMFGGVSAMWLHRRRHPTQHPGEAA